MKEEKNEIIQNCEQRDSSFKTILQKEKNSPLILEFETKENTLIIKITDTDAIGNGLYKCELTKEDLDKKYSSFKMFDDMNKVLEKFKIISTKNYSIKFSENFDTLTFSFNATVFDEEAKFEFILNRIVMNDKEIINQLCEKVKELNSKIKNNLSNEDNILKKLNSSILEKLDEYSMINDLILEKNKSKKSIWTKIFSTNDDGDTAEAFHSKCDEKYQTIYIVKSQKGRTFGGYLSQAWKSSNNYFEDNEAFFFSIDLKKKYDFSNKKEVYIGNPGYGPVIRGGINMVIQNDGKNSKYNLIFLENSNNSYEINGERDFKLEKYEVFQLEF